MPFPVAIRTFANQKHLFSPRMKQELYSHKSFAKRWQSRNVLRTLIFSFLCLLFIASTGCESANEPKTALQKIQQRGYVIVGTAGDYRPMTFKEADGTYWGFDIDLAEMIAKDMGVKVSYVPTSWPTLTKDVLTEGYMDFAIGGITITEKRKQEMLMSDGYLHNGKTILCRASEAERFHSLDDVNQADVTVMVNPGGQNEVFARTHLTNVKAIKVHERNEEIPTLIAEGQADVMITEILEAPYYVQNDKRLAAPLLSQPFTDGEVGVLLSPDNQAVLDHINALIQRIKSDGSLKKLHEKYGFVYRYN